MSNDKHVTEELLREAFIAGAKSQLTNHTPQFAEAVALKAWERWSQFKKGRNERCSSKDSFVSVGAV